MQAPKGEAQSVVIDHERGVVEIDGDPVPYYIAESGPTTEPFGTSGDTLVKFECFVIAEAVRIIGKPREPAPVLGEVAK